MERIDNIVKVLIATVGTTFTWIFGAWDMALIALVLLMCLDWITGLIKAYITQKLSSDTGLRGIARKALMLIVLAIAVIVDRILNTGNWVFRTMVCYFYIANEGISILENCVESGLKVPDQLKNVLIQLNKEKK